MRSRRLVAFVLSLVFVVIACSESDQSERLLGGEWDLRSAPDGSHLSISIGVGSGTCDSLETVEVTERVDRVHIRARVRHVGAEVCTANLVVVNRSIALTEPLGDRVLTGCRPDGDVSAEGFSTVTVPADGDCRDTLPSLG